MTDAGTRLPPWLDGLAAQFGALCAQDRIPHGILICGQAGVGRHDFADWLTRLLHCSAGAEAPCGACRGCRWHAAQSHPDLLVLEPEEGGREIKVDAIRELCGELALTSHAAGYRVARIGPAEAMNANAANALLKTLEEPGEAVVLVLVSERPSALPATLRSRCRLVAVPLPPPRLALDWLVREHAISESVASELLELAGGAPLRALALSQPEAYQAATDLRRRVADCAAGRGDPLALAGALASEPLPAVRAVMMRWVLDRVRELGLGRVRDSTPGQASTGGPAGALAEVRDRTLLFDLWDELLRLPVDRSSGLNQQLQLESLLIRMRRTRAGR